VIKPAAIAKSESFQDQDPLHRKRSQAAVFQCMTGFENFLGKGLKSPRGNYFVGLPENS